MLVTSRREFLSLIAAAAPMAAQKKFSGPLGLELYSFRREAEKDLPRTLATIRSMGFTEIEADQLYGRTAGEFQRLLAASGLKATSMMAEWDDLSKSVAGVSDRASGLGCEYVVCAAIPRKGQLTLADVSSAAEKLNRWGEALAGARLRFCYHMHGPEFVSGPQGTLFDTLAARTDPRFANFEMDVFWVFLGNQNPAKMLERYPGRFPLMHLKDARKGEPKTFDPGPVQEEASVPLGTGQIEWPPVLAAAQKYGVRRYYIEEEHPNAMKQVPESLRYLQAVRF